MPGVLFIDEVWKPRARWIGDSRDCRDIGDLGLSIVMGVPNSWMDGCDVYFMLFHGKSIYEWMINILIFMGYPLMVLF